MRHIVKCLAALALCATANSASATSVTYGATNVAGNTWQYDFAIANDTLPTAINEFTIFFDYSLFDNLQLVSTPAPWDPIAVQPFVSSDPVFPLVSDGFFDYLDSGVGLVPGASLGGFSVTVNFLGTGAPGAPATAFYGPDIDHPLGEGVAVPKDQPVPTPEPATLSLLALGLLGCGVLRRRA